MVVNVAHSVCEPLRGAALFLSAHAIDIRVQVVKYKLILSKVPVHLQLWQVTYVVALSNLAAMCNTVNNQCEQVAQAQRRRP